MSHDLLVEARDAVDGGLVSDVDVSWYRSFSDRDKGIRQVKMKSGEWIRDESEPMDFFDLTAEHQGSLDILYGDVNKDGVVDLEDAIIIQKMLIKLHQMDITGKSRADVTRTGTIDPADVVYILKTLENQ